MTASLISDVLKLMAAIDAGDDSAILPLADALEEAGGTRTSGLRRLKDRRPNQIQSDYGWQVYGPHAAGVTSGEADRLPRGRAWGDWRLYDSRSAAYLALAEALAD